jgi:metallo-beta-lactamase family protein
MRLNFLGADHEVTGSCHFLQACGVNILVDCGMEQGNDVYENQELPIPASEVDYVLLTHAHIDHSGLIPLLYTNGFRGEVYTTRPSLSACPLAPGSCAISALTCIGSPKSLISLAPSTIARPVVPTA